MDNLIIPLKIVLVQLVQGIFHLHIIHKILDQIFYYYFILIKMLNKLNFSINGLVKLIYLFILYLILIYH